MLVNHKCFWLTLTNRQHRSLRRFTFGDKKSCPNNSNGHDASVSIEDGPDITYESDGHTYHSGPSLNDFRNDPRWPMKCTSCDYFFERDDEWQANGDTIHLTQTGLGEMTIGEAPAGAMWDASGWAPHRWRGSDGKCLAVKLPPGGPHDIWMIDGPASKKANEPDTFWARVGSTLPDISVTPSILTNKYHGFLTNGVLIQV